MATYKIYEQVPEIIIDGKSGVYTISNYYLGLERQNDTKSFNDVFTDEEIDYKNPGIKINTDVTWCDAQYVKLIAKDNTALQISFQIESNADVNDRECYLTFYNNDFPKDNDSPKIKIIQKGSDFIPAYYNVRSNNPKYPNKSGENFVQYVSEVMTINATNDNYVYILFKFGSDEVTPNQWEIGNVNRFTLSGKLGDKNISDILKIEIDTNTSDFSIYKLILNNNNNQISNWITDNNYNKRSNNAKILYNNKYVLEFTIKTPLPPITYLYVIIEETVVDYINRNPNNISNVLEFIINKLRYRITWKDNSEETIGSYFAYNGSPDSLKFYNSSNTLISNSVNNIKGYFYFPYIHNDEEHTGLSQQKFENIKKIEIGYQNQYNQNNFTYETFLDVGTTNNIYTAIQNAGGGSLTSALSANYFSQGYLITVNKRINRNNLNLPII